MRVTTQIDLIIGRITYSQDGQQVQQLTVGTPVAIACSYSVNAVPNPFVHIQPWKGNIQMGGPTPWVREFYGDALAGLHEARIIWTPLAAGTVPISCVLNPQFDSAEAFANNNRWNELVDVLPAESPDELPVDEAAVPPVPVAKDPHTDAQIWPSVFVCHAMHFGATCQSGCPGTPDGS